MKIIQINKFYFTRGQGGGASRYFFDLTKLLESNGHQVIPFSMEHPNNLVTPFAKYFVSNLDLTRPRLTWRTIKNLSRIFWSREAATKLEKLIQDTEPDLVHLHNIYYHLTSSILRVCKKYHLPVVMTVHDFNLICPSHSLFDGRKICQDCLVGKLWRCGLKKCVKNSWLASWLAVAIFYFQQWGKFYQKYVDLFLCPSQFVADKLILAGFSMDKIKVLPLFQFLGVRPKPDNVGTDTRKGVNNGSHNRLSPVSPEAAPHDLRNRASVIAKYCLYFGRLEPGKGVDLLIKATKRLPRINLKIIGSGSQEAVLKKLAKGARHIKFLGWQDKQELGRQIQDAEFVIMPARAYETFGLTVLETFSLAKSVIAANLDALPELVRHKQTGLLFEAGDSHDLAEKIKFLWQHSDLAVAMGQAGQKMVQEKYNAASHYQQLINFYSSIDFMSII